jgi:hypothetical protein
MEKSRKESQIRISPTDVLTTHYRQCKDNASTRISLLSSQNQPPQHSLQDALDISFTNPTRSGARLHKNFDSRLFRLQCITAARQLDRSIYGT